MSEFEGVSTSVPSLEMVCRLFSPPRVLIPIPAGDSVQRPVFQRLPLRVGTGGGRAVGGGWAGDRVGFVMRAALRIKSLGNQFRRRSWAPSTVQLARIEDGLARQTPIPIHAPPLSKGLQIMGGAPKNEVVRFNKAVALIFLVPDSILS